MNNTTMVDGWFGAGVADLAVTGGMPIGTARPRHGQDVVFGDAQSRRSGVQQQA